MYPLPQTISLHIGAHKTASSHLQNLLFKNRDVLSETGVRLCGPRYLRMPGRSLAAMFNTSWSNSPAPRRGPLEQLKFLCKDCSHLVVSEENFVGNLADTRGRTALPLYPMAAQRLAELVESWTPVPTELFLAVRDPAAFMTSAYSQAMFGGNHVRPRQYRMRNDWKQVDWADYVARLRAVTGVAHIYVWRQEDYDAALPIILAQLLRWDDTSRIEPLEHRVHRGLSVSAVRRTIEAAAAGETGTLARDARRAYPVGEHYRHFQLYSESIQAKARSAYDAQIEQIEQMKGVTVLRAPADVQRG